MAYKSVYEVKNLEKFESGVNSPTSAVCRSSWERWFCHYLDNNTSVKKWGSECTVIPYLSPIDNRMHRYYLDFTILFKDDSMVLVEVKPYHQTIKPELPKRKTSKAMSRFGNALKTWLVNEAKWNAATALADRNGASFQKFTENELRKLGAPI